MKKSLALFGAMVFATSSCAYAASLQLGPVKFTSTGNTSIGNSHYFDTWTVEDNVRATLTTPEGASLSFRDEAFSGITEFRGEVYFRPTSAIDYSVVVPHESEKNYSFDGGFTFSAQKDWVITRVSLSTYLGGNWASANTKGEITGKTSQELIGGKEPIQSSTNLTNVTEFSNPAGLDMGYFYSSDYAYEYSGNSITSKYSPIVDPKTGETIGRTVTYMPEEVKDSVSLQDLSGSFSGELKLKNPEDDGVLRAYDLSLYTALIFEGYHYNPAAREALDKVPVLSAVPEPETYAMMLGGLGVIGFAARRRKQNAV